MVHEIFITSLDGNKFLNSTISFVIQMSVASVVGSAYVVAESILITFDNIFHQMSGLLFQNVNLRRCCPVVYYLLESVSWLCFKLTNVFTMRARVFVL